MPLKRLFAVLFWGVTVAAVLPLQAKKDVTQYDVPQAEITYKISGGGALNRDLNLTLEGNATRRFRDWGAVEFIETNIVERTNGALHYIAHRALCEKRQEKKILDVDFKTKKILQRPLPKGKEIKKRTEGLQFKGQLMVANVVCDMWEENGVRKCLYKGIPVFREYRLMGLYYREEAVDIRFDINVTDEGKCAMPDYPVEKFSLYTSHFKTKNKRSPQAFSKRLQKAIEILNAKGMEEDKIPARERKRLMQLLGEPIFKEQAVLLPKLLETLKKTRACLVQAEENDAANACLYDLIQIKSYFTGNGHNKIDDWQKDREKILASFDENIITLQRKMKCIRAAKNIDDLTMCIHQ